jgi:DNA-binding response OmpR family regulator
LQQYGYRVIEASDAEEAIAVAGRHPERIHLLLTDVVLPGMNGKDLSERLLVLRPDLKVLFTSGYTADVIAHRGVLDHGVSFLHKPYSLDELAAKVRELLCAPSDPIVEVPSPADQKL